MSQFQRMKTSSLIICQVLFEKLLDAVYEVLVNFLLKFRINSCRKNINLFDDVWVTIFIHIELLPQPSPFNLQVYKSYHINIYAFNSCPNYLLTFIIICLELYVHLPSDFVDCTKLQYIITDK